MGPRLPPERRRGRHRAGHGPVLHRSPAPTTSVTEVGTIGDAAPQGEGGLLGVAVSPAFDQDRTLYFYVSTDDDNRIVTAQLADGRLGATKPILTGIPLGAIHDGGRLAFGPDGMLYASTGETGDSELAQDRDTSAARSCGSRRQGKPAPGNPFGTAIWSYGHRNVQGLAFVDEPAVGLGVRPEHLRRAEPDRAGRQLRLAGVRRRGRRRRRLHRPAGHLGHRRRLPLRPGVRRRRALDGRAARQPALEDPGRGRRPGQPEAFFVGEYGRMRTVVARPRRQPLGDHQQPGRPRRPADDDDRILLVSPGG